VQVALDPAALGVGGGHDLGPAAGQRLDPHRQLLAAAGTEQGPAPGRSRDLDPEQGAEPRPLEGAELSYAPEQQHGPGHGDRRIQHGQSPAAGRPLDQAPDRGHPDQDQPGEHRADAGAGRHAGEGMQRRPPVPCRVQPGHALTVNAAEVGGHVVRPPPG
jgi:hypothetical protein